MTQKYETMLEDWCNPIFCDIDNRPTLRRSLKLLADRIPDDVFDELPNIVLLACRVEDYGRAMLFPASPCALIYLSPAIETDQNQSDFTLAHEVAHVFLGHHNPYSNKQPDQPDETRAYPRDYLNQPIERAADSLAESWGYTLPSYRRQDASPVQT